MLVPDLAPAVARNVTAGLTLAARALAGTIAPDLSMPAAAQIVAAAGATRSRAYELRDAILGALPTLARPPGRPKAQREPAPGSLTADLRGEMLRFMKQHPGCVHERLEFPRYSEGFRLFVLGLRERHADLPLTDFAAARLLPIGTLEDWLRPGRAVATAEPSASVPVAEVVESDIRQTHVETVLAQWRSWNGDFSSFCDHVREHHRVLLGRSLIAGILFAHGERPEPSPTPMPRRLTRVPAQRAMIQPFGPRRNVNGKCARSLAESPFPTA